MLSVEMQKKNDAFTRFLSTHPLVWKSSERYSAGKDGLCDSPDMSPHILHGRRRVVISIYCPSEEKPHIFLTLDSIEYKVCEVVGIHIRGRRRNPAVRTLAYVSMIFPITPYPSNTYVRVPFRRLSHLLE